MVTLEPAISTPLKDDWTLMATEAGRYAAGLTATIAVMNGTMQVCESLPLANEEYRRAFAAVVAFRVKLPAAAIEAKLLELLTGIEARLREQHDDAQEAKASQATRLVELALEAGVTLFHTPDGDAYATMAVDGHQETWPLKVRAFRRWLSRLFYASEDKTPGSQAVQDALGVLEGKALFDGAEHPVYTRLAAHDDAIYLDLADEQWRAIAITASGWRVTDAPPVKFRRARGMLPLPVPTRGGTLSDLTPFVNLGSEADRILVQAWLLATLRPAGPYPILVVHGEQGSAKSTLVRVLRGLVDPNTAALRSTPGDERDLVIAAHNGWVIALDNLSHVPDWLSDALCRIATGGGFGTRELYSDAEETIFNAMRPITANGIEELATRGDLLDRAILLYLPRIPDETRRHEADFWRDFEAARPRILGALLDIVSAAMRTLPTITLDRFPRMADFALWACAAASATDWTATMFLEAYDSARESASALTLDAFPVGSVLREFLGGRWEGTASELLAALEHTAGEAVTRQKAWPKNPRSLSNTLRRLAPTLRTIGINVTLPSGSHKKGRIIQLERVGKFASPASPASPSEENQQVKGDAGGDANPQGGRKPPDGGRKGDAKQNSATPYGSRRGTQGDGGDAKIRTYSKTPESPHSQGRDVEISAELEEQF
jgi:hypothetical protein